MFLFCFGTLVLPHNKLTHASVSVLICHAPKILLCHKLHNNDMKPYKSLSLTTGDVSCTFSSISSLIRDIQVWILNSFSKLWMGLNNYSLTLPSYLSNLMLRKVSFALQTDFECLVREKARKVCICEEAVAWKGEHMLGM